MEPLTLKIRQPVEDDVENWDDDDFALDAEDLTFRSVSSANAPAHRRDSHSSHVSLRSELESIHGEEEKQVHLPGDDEKSTLDAIAAAANIGIPIPKNIPPSALMGGTIKRLGGRTLKKIIQDDWENDLEFPDSNKGLAIKPQDGSKFPDVLRQVSASSVQASPVKVQRKPPAVIQNDRRESSQSRASFASSSGLGSAIDLDRFRDDDDDDDFFGDGAATIKVSKSRQPPKPISLVTPPTPQKTDKTTGVDDDFEHDFELPSDGKLKLSTKKDIPKTPSMPMDDADWGEGSLGTRYGGTRRDGRSNRSSSASALSPSVSSSITAESEDETFDGLVIPTGPLNFEQRLKLRKSRSPDRIIEEEPTPPPPPAPEPKKASVAEADRDDFLSGLDFGDGPVFDSKKLSLHRNVRVKDSRSESPSRPKISASITFTNKPASSHGHSRLPRLSHERVPSSLEPVSESGGPILPRPRRSQSRLGHSAQSSVSSLPTPTTPSSAQSLPPSTPRRSGGGVATREISTKTSVISLRNEPTTTSAQLLRLKRSLPVMRPPASPAKTAPSRFERPPSRTDSSRPTSSLRPKTPVERTRAFGDTFASQARKNPAPFLLAGSGHSLSHHIPSKPPSRLFRRHDSETAIDLRPTSRAMSRSTMRSPSPRRMRNEKTYDAPWRQLSKPRQQRYFGEGHELDGFDDLPTSREYESGWTKQPVNNGPKGLLRNKIYQNVLPDRTMTPSPVTPYSPARSDYMPSFARDTAASRIARETALGQRVPSSGPLAPLTSQRVAQLSTRNNYNPYLPQGAIRSKKNPKKTPQLKPHLIANLNPGRDAKTVNGMFYNPVTYQWEGNENALNAFDPPASSPSTASLPPYLLREKENATPRPALITNISTTKGVQVVGGMVFDPHNMCWLKIGPPTNPKSETGDPLDGFNALDDEDDVFRDIPDLDDNTATSNDGAPGRVSDVKDDWLVGEEFDVGPEFVRRQYEEEERWTKKCEKWLAATSNRDHDAWRWTIRELISGDANL